MQCSHRFFTELCTFIPLVCCQQRAAAAARPGTTPEAHEAAIVGRATVAVANLGGARVAWEMPRIGCCCGRRCRAPRRIRRVAVADALGIVAGRESARKAEERIAADEAAMFFF